MLIAKKIEKENYKNLRNVQINGFNFLPWAVNAHLHHILYTVQYLLDLDLYLSIGIRIHKSRSASLVCGSVKMDVHLL